MRKNVDIDKLSFRNANINDLEQTVAFLNDVDQYDIGVRNFSVDVFGADWKRERWLEANTCLAFSPSNELFAYGEAYSSGIPPIKTIVFARVHPEYRGLGLGTKILEWGEKKAIRNIDKCPPSSRVFISALTSDSVSDAVELFRNFGMAPARSYYRMKLELGSPKSAPSIPEGITLRRYQHDVDLLGLHHAYEAAFAGHWGYLPRSEKSGTSELRNWVESDNSFDSECWILALDGDYIVGFVMGTCKTGEGSNIGQVNELGVIPIWRNKGLGKALLENIFLKFQAKSKTSAILDVDADNSSGAVNFYNHLGMRVVRRRIAFEKTLRAGFDLRGNN